MDELFWQVILCGVLFLGVLIVVGCMIGKWVVDILDG